MLARESSPSSSFQCSNPSAGESGKKYIQNIVVRLFSSTKGVVASTLSTILHELPLSYIEILNS